MATMPLPSARITRSVATSAAQASGGRSGCSRASGPPRGAVPGPGVGISVAHAPLARSIESRDGPDRCNMISLLPKGRMRSGGCRFSAPQARAWPAAAQPGWIRSLRSNGGVAASCRPRLNWPFTNRKDSSDAGSRPPASSCWKGWLGPLRPVAAQGLNGGRLPEFTLPEGKIFSRRGEVPSPKSRTPSKDSVRWVMSPKRGQHRSLAAPGSGRASPSLDRRPARSMAQSSLFGSEPGSKAANTTWYGLLAREPLGRVAMAVIWVGESGQDQTSTPCSERNAVLRPPRSTTSQRPCRRWSWMAGSGSRKARWAR